jgi:hypothetical protein
MFFLMPKNVFFDPSPCFSRSSDDRLGSCYPAAAAATARPSGAWSFFLPAAAFFRFELRARNCFFEQHNNNNKNTQTTRQAVLVLARGRRSGSSSSPRFSGMVFLIG